MNPHFKLILLRGILHAMKSGTKRWRWKTTKAAWDKNGQREIVELALKQWRALEAFDRIKYGGDYNTTNAPREATFAQFLSGEKRKYQHWAGGREVRCEFKFVRSSYNTVHL